MNKKNNIIKIIFSIGFHPNFFQSIIVLFFSFIQSKLPIQILIIINFYKFLILFLSYIIISFFCLTLGYILDYIFQLYLLDWICILYFFIIGIIFLINSEIKNEINLFEEYQLLFKTNNENINKLSLSIIPEAKIEESISMNEETYLLDKNEENKIRNIFFQFFIDLKDYIIIICKNYIFLTMAFLCFIYDSGAVIYASIIDFFLIIFISFIFKEHFLKIWNENIIEGLIGIFMIIISIQLYLSKTFEIRR